LHLAGAPSNWLRCSLSKNIFPAQAAPASSFTPNPTNHDGGSGLSRLTRNRRLVRDYERRTDTHEAMTTIAMIALMSRRLARAA